MIIFKSPENGPSLPCIAISDGEWGVASERLARYAAAKSDIIFEALRQYGAILFRGFQFGGPEPFENFASVFCPELGSYIGGNSPRTRVTGSVFTTTEYSQRVKISLHNEASYLPKMPRRILFYCEVAPTDRGQTPLADSRRIYKRLHPEILDRFATKRVKYVSNMHDGNGLGRNWRDVFQTSDRREVEQRLEADGYEYEWKPDSGLRASIIADAQAQHPDTGEMIWISQAEQWHPSSLQPATRRSLMSILPEEDFPHNAFFGDGSRINDEYLTHIRQIMDEEETLFQWQSQDVLLCDNYLVMHGRQPFTGARRIYCALG